MCFPSTPDIPEAPTPVEPIAPEKIHAQDEGESEAISMDSKRRKLASREGYRSTILAGSKDLGSPTISVPGGGSSVLGGQGKKKKLGG